MPEYETRVLNPDGKTILISAKTLPTDSLAIRSGKDLAQGSKFEVWKGAHCIYSSMKGAIS